MGQSCVQASQQFKCGQNVQNTVDLRANCLYSPLSAASDNMNNIPEPSPGSRHGVCVKFGQIREPSKYF